MLGLIFSPRRATRLTPSVEFKIRRHLSSESRLPCIARDVHRQLLPFSRTTELAEFSKRHRHGLSHGSRLIVSNHDFNQLECPSPISHLNIWRRRQEPRQRGRERRMTWVATGCLLQSRTSVAVAPQPHERHRFAEPRFIGVRIQFEHLPVGCQRRFDESQAPERVSEQQLRLGGTGVMGSSGPVAIERFLVAPSPFIEGPHDVVGLRQLGIECHSHFQFAQRSNSLPCSLVGHRQANP